MESSSSSSRIADESLNQKQSCMANQLLSNRLIVLLPISIPQHTFAPSSLFSRKSICSSNNPNLKALFTTTKTIILHNFQSSIVAAVDKCLRFFHQFDSHNPFFSKVSSLSSDFHNFCLIHRREYRNLNSPSNHNFAAILPGDSVAGIVVANGLLNFFNIYNTLLVCRLVLTWFPNSPPAIVSPLSTLCDPYLNIFRGLIPPLGGTLDLSPILAFLVLNAFTSAASALPAELPPVGISQGIASSSTELSNLTTSQKKWMRRFATNRSKNSSNDI